MKHILIALTIGLSLSAKAEWYGEPRAVKDEQESYQRQQQANDYARQQESSYNQSWDSTKATDDNSTQLKHWEY